MKNELRLTNARISLTRGIFQSASSAGELINYCVQRISCVITHYSTEKGRFGSSLVSRGAAELLRAKLNATTSDGLLPPRKREKTATTGKTSVGKKLVAGSDSPWSGGRAYPIPALRRYRLCTSSVKPPGRPSANCTRVTEESPEAATLVAKQ